MFDLKTQKEVYPYEFCNEDTMFADSVSIKDAYETIKEKHSLQEFEESIRASGQDPSTGVFNLFNFTEFYCKRDVEVLSESFVKFRENLKKEFGIEVIDVLTLSSLAVKY